jgi:hypothetical protein
VSEFAYMCLVETILKGAKQSQTKIKKMLCPKTQKNEKKIHVQNNTDYTTLPFCIKQYLN